VALWIPFGAVRATIDQRTTREHHAELQIPDRWWRDDCRWRDGRVRGVLLWNVWDQVDAARKLIAEAGPFRAEDLRSRLRA
jgi:hypothetical protein